MTVTAVATSAIPVEEAYIFAFAKPTADLEVWHRRLVHTSYRNVLANAKKVIGMENVTGPIPETVCEPCMAGRSQQERSRVPMTKATEFIWKINVDIGTGLPTTFRGNRHFVLLKCDVIEFM